MFILDEADEMLSRGFKDQIYDVFRTLNENIQVSLASFESEIDIRELKLMVQYSSCCTWKISIIFLLFVVLTFKVQVK